MPPVNMDALHNLLLRVSGWCELPHVQEIDIINRCWSTTGVGCRRTDDRSPRRAGARPLFAHGDLSPIRRTLKIR